MRRVLPLVLMLFSLLLSACNRDGTGGNSGTNTPTPGTTPNSTTPGTPTIPSTPDPQSWVWTTDTAVGFKFEMPGQPRHASQLSNGFPEFGPINCVTYSVQNPEANYLVACWDLDTPRARNVPAENLLNSLRNAIAAQDGGVTSDQPVPLKSGQTARECHFGVPSGTLVVRWISANRKFYMLTYAGKTDDRTAHQATTARFLNSFEITGGSGAAASGWVEFIDPRKRYKATFVGAPKLQNTQIPLLRMPPAGMEYYETKAANLHLKVGEIAVRQPPGQPVPDDQVMQELRAALARLMVGQIQSEQPATLQGLNGTEMVVAVGRYGNATVRIFPFEGRYFVVSVQGLDGTPAAEDTARFLGSFQFLNADGVYFSPPEGRFGVRFKSAPQQGNNTLPGPRGPVMETVYRVNTETAAFLVGHADYDGPAGQVATMEQIIAVIRDTAVRTSAARVVSEQPIQVGVASGREILADLPNQTQVRLRWLAHNRRLYSVGVVGLKPGPLPTEEATRFLDSFQIKP